MEYSRPLKFFLRRVLGREKRNAERRVLPGLVAHYWNGGAPIAHRVRDISLSGLYLVTTDRWYPGTVIQMRIQETGKTDDDSDRSIAVQAKVVRVGADGVGLAILPWKTGGTVHRLMRAP